MRTKLLVGLGAAALVLAACASGSGSGTGTEKSPVAADAPDAAVSSEAETDLGPVLADAEGLTLYGLTDDTDGVSTCDGACADAWPPLTVDNARLPTGLDPNLFSVVERSDGTFQLKAGKWPLYRFSGDAAAGDTEGQGSGGVWFAVAPDGSLIKGDAAAPAAASDGY